MPTARSRTARFLRSGSVYRCASPVKTERAQKTGPLRARCVFAVNQRIGGWVVVPAGGADSPRGGVVADGMVVLGAVVVVPVLGTQLMLVLFVATGCPPV